MNKKDKVAKRGDAQ